MVTPLDAASGAAAGEEMEVALDPSRILLFDGATGRRLAQG
jgi:hypothetical protein